MKNIVVLDGYVLNPGDLSWAELEKWGKCTIYDRTPTELLLERARDAEIIITNKVVISRECMGQLPKLRYIGVTATGYNIIDMAAAGEYGIVVTNVPAYSTHSVAQMTFALLLELTNHVALHDSSVRAGGWPVSRDFCYWKRPITELYELAMGIIGYGNIGQAVAGIAMALGMRVLVTTRTPQAPQAGISFVALNELLQNSDVISLHCPLTPETTQLINPSSLALMRPSALLLNTSRGQLIDEISLAEALNTDRLAGAGLDVLSQEPPKIGNPLLTAKNCVITPHLGWASKAARERLLQRVATNLGSFLTGKLQNCVNSKQ